MSRSVLGREFCPKTGSNFQDCFLTSSGLVTCQVFAVWSNVLWPQPNNSELENLLKLERAVMAAKAFKFCHFHGSWWLGRRNESTWTLLRKPCNINSSIVCSVFPVSFQPAQEDRGAQAEAATVCLCCFWGAMWAWGNSEHLCEWCFSNLVLPQCSQAFILLFKLPKSYTAAKISLPVSKLKINWHLSSIIRGLEWGCIQLSIYVIGT